MNFLRPPNLLSLSRIVLMPLLYWLLYNASASAFLIAYIIIGSTDAFDGIVARKLQMVSSLGKALDSIADLIFYISSAYFLYYLYPEVIVANQIYLTIFFTLLGLSFLISGILFRKPVMMHTRLLRLNGVLVYLVIIASFYFDTTYFARAVILSYIVGFSEEILIFIFYGHVDPDTKSIFHLLSADRVKSIA